MPTSHIFVVENGVSKKVSKLSRRYRHYKKLLSTANIFMSSAQNRTEQLRKLGKIIELLPRPV